MALQRTMGNQAVLRLLDRGANPSPPRSSNAGLDEAVAEIAWRYLEPLAALQDDDLEFLDPIEYAYYTIYNAFVRYRTERVLDDWLIVNQALAALPAALDEAGA